MSSLHKKASVNEYLEGLPKNIQDRLYELPATCLAIYRLLPPMGKFFVMLMVFHDKPVPKRELDKWVKPLQAPLRTKGEAWKSMRELRLVEEREGLVALHEVFRRSFRNALTGGETHNAFGMVCDGADAHSVDVAFLDEYAAARWENILHFMVGTPGMQEQPSQLVLQLLKHAGLMDGASTTHMRITKEGFQFLLQDVTTQIWTLLLQYLNLATVLLMDLVDVLNFIFMLGLLELGRDYQLAALSSTQLVLLEDLRDYGLVYQRKSSLRRFYPTRLATTLTLETVGVAGPQRGVADGATNAMIAAATGSADTSAPSTSTMATVGSAAPSRASILAPDLDGYIVIETNFRLYAYTTLPLQIAILSLFVHLRARFANMITGQLTRELIRRALYSGITAEQIIYYLETHAHPQMRRLAEEKLAKKVEFDRSNNIKTADHRLEVLPPTVVDQIRLWQLELDRIQTWDGKCFLEFGSDLEFDLLTNYAEDIGVLLWKDKNKKKFFVTDHGASQVVAYAKSKLAR